MAKYKICTTSKTISDTVKVLGVDHDKIVKEWKRDLERNPDSPGFQIIGDNLDLRFKVRHGTNENLNPDYHWYNAVAMKDAVSGLHLSEFHQRELCNVALHEFLPGPKVMDCLRQNFIVLLTRWIVKRLPAFRVLRRAVIYHIDHPYSEVMAKKTEEVSRSI